MFYAIGECKEVVAESSINGDKFTDTPITSASVLDLLNGFDAPASGHAITSAMVRLPQARHYNRTSLVLRSLCRRSMATFATGDQWEISANEREKRNVKGKKGAVRSHR